MLQKFIVQGSSFFLIGSSSSKLILSFFSITKIYLIFFDKISLQKIVLQVPSSVYLFFLSKKSFFIYNPFLFSKQSFLFFQKFSFFFKTTSNFLQKFFVFKVYIKGIGFKFDLFKNFIKIFVGFSHSIYIYLPNVSFRQTDSQSFFITGLNKQLLGEYSARMLSFKKPDPYKNKGVFFINLAKEKITKTLVFKTNFQKKNK